MDTTETYTDPEAPEATDLAIEDEAIENATPETEAPEAVETPEAEDAETKTRNAPTYKLSKVADLPEEAPGGRGRSSLYFDLLGQITSDPGEWYEVAHFKTPNGAQDVRKALENGDRQVPDGEWEYASRKQVNPDNPAGPKHSKLFARFLG
jgi:hypothetical protein